MLSTERIRIMTRLNRYEEGPKKGYLKINHMYRSDYIGMNLLKNFVYITIGYLLILLVYVFYHLDELMENWFRMDLIALGKQFGIGYLVVLIGYSVLVYLTCTVHYHKMKKYIQAYDAELNHLEEQYAQSDRREDEWQ